MDLKGLSEICGDLGFFEEKNGVRLGYRKSEFCLDNLKDLQRFLRRDDPQRRDVFKQLCKWKTVSEDLVPIIEHCQNDRNLVINAVKILVFLTMPIDPASDNIPQQIEYLWSLKSAVTRNVTIAVIVSLLEGPLEHLERDSFTEDDWKLVQLVLTLFRNILAIQEITLQQKASGSATQFLCLRDRSLELLFQENVMDLILVLTQHVAGSCGYLRQDNILLLETFHYIFFGQDPELIAKAYQKDPKVDGDIKTSLNSLRSIMDEEEERRRLIKLHNLNRHSQFSGTFTRLAVDGSKTLFKGSPATAAGDGLLRAQKVQRGPLKRIVWDHGNLSMPKGNVLELLHDFVNQFLSGGYNVLMQSIRVDIEKEHHGIQNSDVINFFQLAHFATAFQCHKFSSLKSDFETSTSEVYTISKNADDTLFHGDICGPIAATMNEAMFLLVISKWRDAFDGLKETNDYKFLSASGSLMKDMIQVLDLVLKLLPEQSKEPQTARILLYKIFYDQTDQGMTQFLVNLIRAFDTHKQPKSYLADLVEIIHVVLQLMEKLQARGALRVSRKKNRRRKKKQFGEKNEVAAKEQLGKTDEAAAKEAGNMPEVNGCVQNSNDQNLDIGNASPEPDVNLNKLVEEDLKNSSYTGKEEGTLLSGQIDDHKVPLLDSCNIGDDLVQLDENKSTNDLNELAYSSSGDDQPVNEVDFSVSKLVSTFANNTVIQNLCWLLKFYRSNSACTNQYIVGVLQRICDDLELSPMLYQLSLLTVFYEILSDQKSSSCKEYKNIISFLTKLVRKLLKKMRSQPLLFVEILFWKSRKECHYINSESLLHELGNLKKQTRGWGNIPGDDGQSGSSMGKEVLTKRSIADALGEDEADFIISHELNNQIEETPSEGNNHVSEEKIYDSVGHLKHSKKRIQAFSKEQELMVKDLFEQFKNHKRCSHMIANALDADNKYTAVQISHKLKQLGLNIPKRKRRLEASNQSAKDNNNNDTFASESKEQLSNGESIALKKRRKGKGNGKLINAEATITSTSKQKIETQLPQKDDSDDETLITILQKSRRKNPENKEDKANLVLETTIEDVSKAMTPKKVRESHGPVQDKDMDPSRTDVDVAAVDMADLDDNLEDELANVADGAEAAERAAPAGGKDISAVDMAYLDDNQEDELANIGDGAEAGERVAPAEGMDISSKVDSSPPQQVYELEDSGDDMGPMMPKSIGLRRKLKMVIDFDDDDDGE
ncbi:Timeless protein [Cinnamomum micranthum f. kanehirae]|uniref:Timeless protein n=1 Tax=Cinnamomum micranthum f. kanehirae TaxID=337451 RepID=A0A443PR90_9MAGN|nr:Timeless protein [Cinnamomum micranthum f. kanehirae]